jgi:hypothetical protein
MQGHESTPRLTLGVDLAVVVVAVVLMLGGAVLMLTDVVSAGIAIPLITVGIALIAMEQIGKRL